MDRLESMFVLVAAVEAGTLSGAARKLGMPLATVSRKVSELEKYLKTQLVTRSSRRLALTDAGLAYHSACKRILEQITDAERAAGGEYSAPRGELVLTAPVVFGRLHVLPVVNEFLATYPDIDVRLVLSDRVTNLLEEHVDVALRIGDLPDSSLVALRVGSMLRVVCASPTYLRSSGTPARPDDLLEHHCITFENLSGPEAWTFKSGASMRSVAVHSRLAVNTAEAAIDAAIAGTGVTRVFSYQIEGAEKDGKLVRILRAFEPKAAPIHLVHVNVPLLPLKLRAFLDLAANRLKERLSRKKR